MTATQNTTLVGGLAASGRFNPEALKQTVAAVSKFADRMRKEHKVPDSRLYVVGSSGLFSALTGKADLIRMNREALVGAVRSACGLPMDFLDIGREAALTVVSVIPSTEAAGAVLLDIGSGDTKGGALDGDKGIITFGIPFGTVTFTDLVKARAGKGDFAATAAALRAEVLRPALEKQLQRKKSLAARGRVYLSGGTVWALATLLRPEERGAHVPLSAADIDAFHKLLLASPGAVPVPDLSKIADPEVRKQARREVEQVRRTFTREHLLGGTEILKALAAAFHFGDEGRQVAFARNGYLGWILGYVKEKGQRGP